MAETHEPLQEVRKSLQIPWYRCPIDRAVLKELTTRSDPRGAAQAAGFVLLLAILGAATWYLFSRTVWVGFGFCLFAYGTVYSFVPGLSTHELSHGTVFKTRWLNDALLRLLSLISWSNFHDYKMSHTYHHLYTLHPRGDREVVLPMNPNVRPLLILQLLTLNVVGGRGEGYSWPMARGIGGTVRVAFTGRHGREWEQAVYADQPDAQRRSVRWARLTLLFHAVLIAGSIVLGLWMLPVLVTFASFIANWLRYFVSVPMHTGLKDNVADFRLCVRSITLDPISGFLYWHMNWHTEHHMFAAVPCYNLRRLHRTVAADMPAPRTLVGAWREMRQTWKRQQRDPAYQFETPLPGSKEQQRGRDPSEGSLGDLEE
jgi:fatty acid desaturase